MDRTLGAFKAIIQRFVGNWIVGPHVDYLASYPSTAVTQNADGTLEIQPDDSRLPSLSSVPIRYGVPGVSAQIANGGRVLLSFAGGDPAKPIATVWESASVTALVFNGGSQGVARTADAVAWTAAMNTWITAVTGALAGAGPASKIPLVAPLDFGTISGGSAVVKAG
jgi:hypothetical protein